MQQNKSKIKTTKQQQQQQTSQIGVGGGKLYTNVHDITHNDQKMEATHGNGRIERLAWITKYYLVPRKKWSMIIWKDLSIPDTPIWNTVQTFYLQSIDLLWTRFETIPIHTPAICPLLFAGFPHQMLLLLLSWQLPLLSLSFLLHPLYLWPSAR